jgi:crossover junction endodeoxyribonuclease RuvC
MGIDCGIAITGWAVIDNYHNKYKKELEIIDYGVISTKSSMDIPKRLELLYKSVIKLVNTYKPSCTAIESLFYFKNKKTVINVAQARGVVLLACAQNKVKTYDYTPLQVKQALTGYGKASKEQVKKMIKLVFKLKEIPKQDDAADALAIGFCHINNLSYKVSFQNNN